MTKKDPAVEAAEDQTLKAPSVEGASELSLKSVAQPEKADGDPVHKIDFNAPSALVPEIEQVEENLKA